ncbi:Metallo-dependent hydrolase [Colletotrichum falcatum]|nr:Metallo-dependent hydrolase [Colletotrichum falcatum]
MEKGVRGFKGFLIESGPVAQVNEFPCIFSTDIEQAMRALAGHPITLMFHAEMIPPIADSVGDTVQVSEPPLAPTDLLTSYDTFLDSRPPVFDTCAIEEILSLAHLAPQLHLHIVHRSATECIPILKQARKDGVNITAKTCFHYLGLAAEDVEDGGTHHKCCSPIRSRINQAGLWEELCADPDESVIKTVVSDQSPCTPELKPMPGHLQQQQHAEAVDTVEGTLMHSDSGVDVTMPGPAAGRVRETWLRGRKVYEFGGDNGGFVCDGPIGEAIVKKRTV